MARFSKLFQSEKERQSTDVLEKCVQSLDGMRRASLLVESGGTALDSIYRREGEARFKPVEVSLLLRSLTAMSAAGVLKNLLNVMPEGSADTEIVRACLLLLDAQTLEITEEARQAVLRVADELDKLVTKLNRAVQRRVTGTG
jgi:hypothetical protein